MFISPFNLKNTDKVYPKVIRIEIQCKIAHFHINKLVFLKKSIRQLIRASHRQGEEKRNAWSTLTNAVEEEKRTVKFTANKRLLDEEKHSDKCRFGEEKHAEKFNADKCRWRKKSTLISRWQTK